MHQEFCSRMPTQRANTGLVESSLRLLGTQFFGEHRLPTKTEAQPTTEANSTFGSTKRKHRESRGDDWWGAGDTEDRARGVHTQHRDAAKSGPRQREANTRCAHTAPQLPPHRPRVAAPSKETFNLELRHSFPRFPFRRRLRRRRQKTPSRTPPPPPAIRHILPVVLLFEKTILRLLKYTA